MLNYRHIHTLGPHGKLFGSRRPERVSGGQHRLFATFLIILRKLAYRCRLTYAVHTNDKYYSAFALIKELIVGAHKVGYYSL